MSSRLNQAIAAGKVVLTNQGSIEVAVTLMKTVGDAKAKRPVSKKVVVTLRPGRPTNLTDDFTIEDLRASPGLAFCVANRQINVEDTWTTP